MASLRRLVERARVGRGGAIIVEGEAGIGKTHLVEECLAIAEGCGCVVAIGTQDPIGISRPFGVLIDAVGRIDSPEWPDGFLDATALQLHDTLVETVQKMAAEVPVVLCIENLHWVDRATLHTLGRLARLASQMSLAMILTTRPIVGNEPLHRLAGIIADSDGEHHRLHRLDDAQIVDLAAARYGAAPGPKLIDRLTTVGGNPLLALELLQGLAEHDALAISDGTLELESVGRTPPVSLTILRRLSILSQEALDVVRSASILGPEFTLDDLRITAQIDTGPMTDAIEEALAAGVLEPAVTDVRFRHTLVWELLYDDISEPVRRALHLDAATALVEAGRPPEAIIDHLLLGLTRPDRRDVQLVLDTAAAMRPRSPDIALRLVEHTLSVAEGGDQLPLRAEHALLLLATGQHRRGREACRTVLDSGIRHPLRSRVREALLASLTMGGRLDEAVRLCEQTLTSPSLDPADRAQVTASLAFAKLSAGHFDASIDLAELVTHETPDAEPAIVARALTTKAHALSHMGRFSECVDVALAVAADLDERGTGMLHFAHAVAGSRLLILDRFDDAHDILERGRRLYERHGSTAALCQYHVSKGYGHFLRGDWDDAVAELTATEDLADEGLAWPVLSHGVLALIAAYRNDAPTAEAHLQTIDAALETGASALRVDLALHARQVLLEGSASAGLRRDGGADAVAALAREEWDALSVGSPRLSSLGFTPEIACTLARAGDDETARRIADALDACAAVNPEAPSIMGASLLARGVVEDDLDLLSRSVETYRASGNVLAKTFAQRTTAAALLDAGELRPGIALLREAWERCQSIGVTTEARQIDAVLKTHGVPPLGQPVQRPAHGWDALTPTELVVVGHLGRRLSNPEIAEEMHVSRRTVESHVSRILAKLGVRSRIDVARLTAAQAPVGAASARRYTRPL